METEPILHTVWMPKISLFSDLQDKQQFQMVGFKVKTTKKGNFFTDFSINLSFKRSSK